MSTDAANAKSARDAVAGMARRSEAVTFSFEWSDVPRSPWKRPFRNAPYWERSGRSSPRACRMASTSEGAAPSPSMTATGSPGIR
jgi:hypothetical protein